MKVNNIQNKELIDQIKALYEKKHDYLIELQTEAESRPVGATELDWIVATLTTEDELQIAVPPGEVIIYNQHEYCGPSRS